jgi:hypothetical protein
MTPEENDKLFVVRWMYPRNDATTMVLCECCGAVRYSSAENVRAAKDKEMQFVCRSCAERLVKEHGGIVCGTIRGGEVLDWERNEKTR